MKTAHEGTQSLMLAHQWKLTDFAFASLNLKCWVPAKVQYSKDAHTAAKEFSVEARKCGGKKKLYK